jgi:hypothetical protein
MSRSRFALRRYIRRVTNAEAEMCCVTAVHSLVV